MRVGVALVLLTVVCVADVFTENDVDGDGKLDTIEFKHAQNDIIKGINSGMSKALKNPIDHVLDFWPAFMNSLMMIWATEIGDKTFFIAAIMAMKHDRAVVFAGALGALAIMTVLSAAMGYVLPNLMPRSYTHYMAAFLFLYFGLRLIKDGSQADGSGMAEEMEEAQEELGIKMHGDDGDGDDLLEQGAAAKAAEATSKQKSVFWQALTLTFVAEWGDRSQIATIALGAAKDPYGVCVGGILGHAMCTGLAVVGGRYLSAYVTEKQVNYFGGVLFLLFAVHSLVSGE